MPMTDIPAGDAVKSIRSLSDLTPDTINANRGTERGAGMLEDSLRQHGAGRSILVDRHGNVIAGNKTLDTAAQIGLEDVIVVPADGTRLVVVQRTDIDLDSPEGRALALADNRTGELNLNWDAGSLIELSDLGVNLADFWHEDELNDLLLSAEADTQGVESGLVGTVINPSVTPSGSEGVDRIEREGDNSVSGDDTQGLDRVVDQETSQAGRFLHFGALKVPLTEDEERRLQARLDAYREEVGTFYGFVGRVLSDAK